MNDTLSYPIKLIWISLAATLVMLPPLGFCRLVSGLVRSKNSWNVAINNLADFRFAATRFWSFDSGIMRGASASLYWDIKL